MAILGRLKDAIGMAAEEEQYEYQCTVCHTTFESSESSPNAAACTACGATDVEPVGG